jgi:sec-independent protein translocase protein TatB
MFDVGFWELVLIFALGLLVLGPEKLPKVAAQLGNWAGQARRMARILTTQLQEEIDKEAQRQEPEAAKPQRPAYSRPGLDELRRNSPHPDEQAGLDELRANAPHTDEATSTPPNLANPPPGTGGSPN